MRLSPEYPERYRCDVCKKMIPKKAKPKKIKDTIYNIELDACSQNCRDNYWMHHYQPHLPLSAFNHPYSNTGVLLISEAGDE